AQEGVALLSLSENLGKAYRSRVVEDVRQGRGRSYEAAESPQPATGVQCSCGEPVQEQVRFGRIRRLRSVAVELLEVTCRQVDQQDAAVNPPPCRQVAAQI